MWSASLCWGVFEDNVDNTSSQHSIFCYQLSASEVENNLKRDRLEFWMLDIEPLNFSSCSLLLLRSWCSMPKKQRVSWPSVCPFSPPWPSKVAWRPLTSARTLPALLLSPTPRSFAGCCWMESQRLRKTDAGRTNSAFNIRHYSVNLQLWSSSAPLRLFCRVDKQHGWKCAHIWSMWLKSFDSSLLFRKNS